MFEFYADENDLLKEGRRHDKRDRHQETNFPLRCERPASNLYYNYCKVDNYWGVTQVIRVFFAGRWLQNAQKLKTCFRSQKKR